MAWSGYFNGTTGLTYYAKPIPVVESPWGDDAIASGAEGFGGEYPFTGLTDGVDYAIFIQAGGSPASSDVRDGSLYYRASNITLPSPSQVLAGVSYGTGGSLTGLLAPETSRGAGLSRRAVRKIELYSDEEHSVVIGCSDDWTGSEDKAIFAAQAEDGTIETWSPSPVPQIVGGNQIFTLNSVARLTDGSHGNVWKASLRHVGDTDVRNVYDVLVKYAP